MRRLALLYLTMLGVILLPYVAATRIPLWQRHYIAIAYAGVMLVAAAGVILLWREESREGAPRTPTLIKMVLYAGALLLIPPLRPFALSFYPLALMMPVALGLLLMLSRAASAPAWLRTDLLQRWSWSGFAFLLANGIVLARTAFFAPPAIPAASAPPHQQVQDMAVMDQADRSSGRILLAPGRDDMRLRTVESLVQKDALTTPDDWLAAALILQHGHCPRHFEMAYELARRAHEAGATDAEWLMQAAYDRWQLSLGKPQKYGTQPDFRPGAGGCDENK